MGPDTVSGGNTIVIDLGLHRGEPDTYRNPSRRTTPAWFGPVIIGLLVLVSSVASAAPPPPALSPVFSLRVGPADSFALTDEELLAQTLGMISAYQLSDGQLRWRSGQDRPTYRPRTANGLVLMRPWTYGPGQPSTTALSLATGRPQWKHEGTVMTIAGSSTLLAVSSVRSGSSASRRVHGPVESLDPLTGAARWRVDVPSTAVLLGIPGPGDAAPRMMLLHDDRVAAVHDLATGLKLASTELPPANYGPDNPTVSGGLILLRHLGQYGVVVSAYDPVTLRLQWRRPAGRAYEVRSCGDFACLVGQDGVRAIRPSDGHAVWYRPGWRGVEQRGPLLLAYGQPTGTSDPVGVIDPATGRVDVDLTGWRLVGGSGGDHVLVTRAVEAGARTMVAVAAAGSAAPRPLADLPPGTGDCQAAPNRLVCRSTSGELNVWAYRKKDQTWR
jgi:outer membrane protein assembly factor BamB